MLLCPVCSEPLEWADDGRIARCTAGHTYNRAHEGYLNLLRTSKSGDKIGDPKGQARSRRDFLNAGYYQPLRDKMVELVQAQVAKWPPLGAIEQTQHKLTLLDICCGEGYYTSAMGRVPGVTAYGFDLSKEMVRLAAKRGYATYFVANLKAIPVLDNSFDITTHLFAPFNEAEFARVLKPGGVLYTVVPGARHLWGLKEVLYDTPYLNDEKLPTTSLLEFAGSHKITAHIELQTPQDIEAVFEMTPYYYRTRQADKERLYRLDSLETDIEFVIGEYHKPYALHK